MEPAGRVWKTDDVIQELEAAGAQLDQENAGDPWRYFPPPGCGKGLQFLGADTFGGPVFFDDVLDDLLGTKAPLVRGRLEARVAAREALRPKASN